jgi:hypothetical protein
VSIGKKILLALLLVLIGIQFIRPARNRGGAVQTADMIVHLKAPADVSTVFKRSCYDCHSNNTCYPWYAEVQPVGWILAHHVNDGRKELNFNEFGSYSKRRQLSKLKSIRNSIKDGSMPLPSYTLLHRDARLSEEGNALLMQWTAKVIDSLTGK